MIEKKPILEFITQFDLVISFNTNPDHSRYLDFYNRLIEEEKMRKHWFFAKNILITTVGIKELFFGFFCKLMFKNVTHMIHDFEPHPGRKYFFTKTYNKIASLFFELSFHSISQAKKYGLSSSVTPLPIVKRIDVFKVSFDGYFLSFGRNEEYKNFTYVEELAVFFPDYEFVICSKNYVAKTASPNLKIISNYQDDEKLEKLIKGAFAVILPYSSATQSGVIVDSYSFGVPVLVSDVPGLKEYVTKNTGAIFKLGNFKSFENAVNDLQKIDFNNFEKDIINWNKNFIITHGDNK